MTTSLGRTFGTAGERIARLGELVAAIRKEESHLPLLLAGAGPKMLTIVAKDADTVTFTWRPQTTVAEAGEVVERFRRIAGERASEIELNLNLMAVGRNLPTEVQPYMGVSMAGLAEMGAISALVGDPDECAATVRQLRADWGFSYITVNAQYMEQFAPVLEVLRGS
jgi:alkanesulfonate monooxygenase SsuD/methylene tetrahydromethanopterin reductase-like flavin-dependent oxidoreductase (luciferase family)